MNNITIGFIGTGYISKVHAYALTSLPFYYDCYHKNKLSLVAVTSPQQENSLAFASNFGFALSVQKEDFWNLKNINTLFILSPNAVHCDDLSQALTLPNIKRIYLEKPVCISGYETEQIEKLVIPSDKKVHIGFQFLQMSVVRKALSLWHDNQFGEPLHFRAHYLHSGYLDPEYRAQRKERLKPTPIGGAIADLGSHVLSLLVAFLGENLAIIAAQKSGNFPEVDTNSDLCSEVLLKDKKSGAVGSLTVSRISKGAREHLAIEIRGTRGSFCISTEHPDTLKVCLGPISDTAWTEIYCGSDFSPQSNFPSKTVSAGWLRSYVHALHLFLHGKDDCSFIPDLKHGIVVQKLINDVATKLTEPV